MVPAGICVTVSSLRGGWRGGKAGACVFMGVSAYMNYMYVDITNFTDKRMCGIQFINNI